MAQLAEFQIPLRLPSFGSAQSWLLGCLGDQPLCLSRGRANQGEDAHGHNCPSRLGKLGRLLKRRAKNAFRRKTTHLSISKYEPLLSMVMRRASLLEAAL